jgi:hypothetical protein
VDWWNILISRISMIYRMEGGIHPAPAQDNYCPPPCSIRVVEVA